jgi:hypothetical protein
MRVYVAMLQDYDGGTVEGTAATLEACKELVEPGERMAILELCVGETGPGREVAKAIYHTEEPDIEDGADPNFPYKSRSYAESNWRWRNAASGGGD